MLFIDEIKWWYGVGWMWAFKHFLIVKNKNALEFFSAPELIKTLFAPYRQTFAGSARGTIGDKFRALIDRTISRIIGFIVRIILILSAVGLVIINSVIGIAVIVLWPIIPISPIFGIILCILGVSNAV